MLFLSIEIELLLLLRHRVVLGKLLLLLLLLFVIPEGVELLLLWEPQHYARPFAITVTPFARDLDLTSLALTFFAKS